MIFRQLFEPLFSTYTESPPGLTDERAMRFAPGVLLAALLSLCAVAAAAQDKAAPPPIQREIIPGSELMTARERERYRQRIRGARTADEQSQVRAQHVKRMGERARIRGLALPEAQKAGTP